ncbi:hypothetical protein ACOMHN_061523 [Nucella lapillus]
MTSIPVIEEPDELRKSMPSLSVGFDQQTVQEAPDQGARPTESPREVRKSGGSGASFSSSNGGENITTQLENSSPKLAAGAKKTADYNQLPPHVSKSKNTKFHKLFKNVPMEEYPIDTYSCAFKGDILLQGLMYVSQNWICFYSKIRARGRLLEIPLEKVISITREKLALIIPNAIGIQVADQKYVFGSFISRDNTYKLLVTLWKHSQDSTDSTNTKENELSCYDEFQANKSGRAGLVGGSRALGEDEITHSADVSGESDTTEEDNESEMQDALLETAPCSTQSSSSTTTTSASRRLTTTEAGGDGSRSPPEKVTMAGTFSLRSIDGRKVFDLLSWFTIRLQTIPRTNLLLAICGILVVFLMMSAAGLAYKILLLQTRLEMSHLWTPGRQHSLRDQTMSSLYSLQSQTHLATIHQLHDVLKANIQLLEQVHQSLKSLQGPAVPTSSSTTPLPSEQPQPAC